MALPAALAKMIIFAIGTSMWMWMQAYVKVQVARHGHAILEPHRRSEPPELKDAKYGMHESADVNGILMHFVHKGCDQDRPILLLLHGFLDFWFIWNRQIPILGEQFCVVAPDLRGYGLTSKPTRSAEYLMVKLVEDVRQLILMINPQKKKRLILVGHDWGGMISFCLATLHEDLISQMIIINGMHPKAFLKQLLQSPRQMRMSWYMIPFRHPEVPEQYLIMRDFAFFDSIHKGFTEREEYAHKYMFSQRGALTGAVNYYRAFNDDREQLDKLPYRVLRVPTLILWGQKDNFITPRVGTYNQEWLARSTIVFYRHAGHWVLRECYDSVNEYIANFALSGKLTPRNQRMNTSRSTQNGNACAHWTTPTEMLPESAYPLIPVVSSVSEE